MQCESLGPRLSAWVDGELNWLDAWLVARHVASCPACAAEVEEMRALNTRLAAANPVFTPLEAPVRTGGPIKPLMGVGALVAAGVAGFMLLPRPQDTGSFAPAPTPAAKMAQASPAPMGREPKNLIEEPKGALPVPPPPVVALENGLPASAAGRSQARGSMRVAKARPRTEVRTRRVTRRPASVRAFDSTRPRKRQQPERLPTSSLVVAKAETGPAELTRDMLSAPPPAAAPVVTSPEVDSVKKSGSSSEAMTLPTPPPAAVAAKPAGDAGSPKMKTDARVRPSFGTRAVTSRSAAVLREENQDSTAPRKRVVPVLVVTPTRYENVVTVTAGAIEVDDETDGRDDREETSQP